MAVDNAMSVNVDEDHSDVITAKVTYRGGHEYDDEVRVNGKAGEADAPLSSGAWSIGEFALSLPTIFLAPSQPDLRFIKQQNLKSTSALLFAFHVLAQNNKYYFLQSGNDVWYPAYHGRIWLNANNFQLLKLERETAEMPDQHITRVKTVTEYSLVALGDGTSMVLPVHSNVIVCGKYSGCARNIVTFSKWQKFRAKAKVLLDPISSAREPAGKDIDKTRNLEPSAPPN